MNIQSPSCTFRVIPVKKDNPNTTTYDDDDDDDDDVYLLSAHSIRFDAHGAIITPITKTHIANKEKSYRYPFTTPGSRETVVDRMPCLMAYALGGLEPPTL